MVAVGGGEEVVVGERAVDELAMADSFRLWSTLWQTTTPARTTDADRGPGADAGAGSLSLTTIAHPPLPRPMPRALPSPWLIAIAP